MHLDLYFGKLFIRYGACQPLDSCGNEKEMINYSKHLVSVGAVMFSVWAESADSQNHYVNMNTVVLPQANSQCDTRKLTTESLSLFNLHMLYGVWHKAERLLNKPVSLSLSSP